MGSGARVRFCKDEWMEEGTLAQQNPSISIVAHHKDATIKESLVGIQGRDAWSWK